jgi:hypothetical protein
LASRAVVSTHLEARQPQRQGAVARTGDWNIPPQTTRFLQIISSGSTEGSQYRIAHLKRCSRWRRCADALDLEGVRSARPAIPDAAACQSPWRKRSACSSSWIDQVFARPPARLGARGERSEIECGDAAEGLAAVWSAMRDNIVTCGVWPLQVANSSLKKIDRGIEIVTANGTCTPNSHDLCEAPCRMICCCRATLRAPPYAAPRSQRPKPCSQRSGSPEGEAAMSTQPISPKYDAPFRMRHTPRSTCCHAKRPGRP